MGMMETILFGLLALTCVISALACLRRPPLLGLLLGLAAVAFVFLSGYNWRLALMDSGKDTAWLGFSRYPPAPVILAVLLILTCFPAHLWFWQYPLLPVSGWPAP